MKRLVSSAILGLVILITACDKDGDTKKADNSNVEIAIRLIQNGAAVSVGQELAGPDGIPLKIAEYKQYLSNIEFKNESGEFVRLQFEDIPGAEQGVFLHQLGKNESFKGFLPAGTYSAIRFGLGLDEATNNLNPNQFSRQHPLSRNTDMFWDMLKYRFVVFEGTIDKDRDGNNNFYYTYHLGGGAFYRTVELTTTLSVAADKIATQNLSFDVSKMFSDGVETIDMTTFFSFHSEGLDMARGIKLMDFIAGSVQ